MPSDPAKDACRVAVLLPLPLAGAYDYRVPAGQSVEPGAIVRVPLGPRTLHGVVWGDGDGALDEVRLRDLGDTVAAPPLAAPLRRFVDWVAAYTLAPPGAVLRMVLGPAGDLAPAIPTTAYVATAAPPPARLTAARRRVLDLAADGVPRAAADLARQAGVSPGVVRGLADAGALAAVPLRPHAFAVPDADRAGPPLAPAQAAAAADLVAKAANGFSVSLLDGVTGAGKTEVYFEAVAAALRQGAQVLVLLPEIALSAQWLRRFADRFGCAPAEWHSDLPAGLRRRTWRAVAEGEARVVVGARSALFLPFARLGLIVVDEEHDGSYKQEDGVIYQARDMAVVRARLEDRAIVLVSATPSLETVANVEQGRYAALHLPTRHGGASLPAVEVVDMRRDGPPDRRHWLSPALASSVKAVLDEGEQAMLFLNRRGYAPMTLCRACGHRLACPQCSTWLVEHRLTSRLQCHHCGYAVARPEVCPSCGVEGRLAPCGPGVERIAEEAAAAFPGARLAVMASDTIESARAAEALVQRMTERTIDVLIGTQIVAKGHHFPWLTLVGVVDADLGLAGGDLRASERTYQLLHQVAGRAGRAERPGRVILQTYQPEHRVIAALASGDRDRFVAEEMAERRAHAMPPFGRLAALVVSGVGEERVRRAAERLGARAPRDAGVQVLGPAPAPLSLLRGRSRYRFLVKADRTVNMQRVIRAWLDAVELDRAIRVQVDIDPYGFL
jgi:primosomal protein N' (replication factor Y)